MTRISFTCLNNSRIVYKIYKEGPAKIRAKLGKVEATVSIDIKFGKKYYIECLLDSSPPKTTAVIKLKDGERGRLILRIL